MVGERLLTHLPTRQGMGTGMIILGVVLLVLGFVFAIPVLWSIGLVVFAVGARVVDPGRHGPGDRRPQILVLTTPGARVGDPSRPAFRPPWVCLAGAADHP